MTESVAIVQSEIKTLFAGDASGHDYWHTLRVYRLARRLAEAYPCDETLVALAALLHDADDPKLFSGNDYRNTRRILKKAAISEEMTANIISFLLFPRSPSTARTALPRTASKEKSYRMPTAWMPSAPSALREPLPTADPGAEPCLTRPKRLP